MVLYVIRAVAGRENKVIEAIYNKIKTEHLDVKSIFNIPEVKGYIYVEGELPAIQSAIKGLPHIHGIIKKPVQVSEIARFLELKKQKIKVERGDIAEVMSGPFKGEKGKVTRVDETKNEVTIELLEAVVPIPITIPIDVIRISKHTESKEG